MDEYIMTNMIIAITAFFLAGWTLISIIEEIIEEVKYQYHRKQYFKRKGFK